MPFRVLLSFFLLPFFTFAQYSGLATTEDGEQLYFSSSLVLRGTEEHSYPKIFRYVGKFELYRQVQPQGIPPFDRTNAFQLTDPEVTADGKTVAYTAYIACNGGRVCLAIVTQQANVDGANVNEDLLQDGRIRLSADGKYVLMFGGLGLDFSPRLIEIASGKVIVLVNYFMVGDGRQAITDDGSLLLQNASNNLVLWKSGSVTALKTAHLPLSARISRNGAKVVYETSDTSNKTLRVYDVSTATETLLVGLQRAGLSSGTYFSPRISSDGQRIIYLLTNANAVQQVFLVQADGLNPHAITNAPEGITEAVLSGNGNVAYATTARGRLLRIHIPTGTETELIPATPQMSVISSPAAGSLAQLMGTTLNLVSGIQVGQQAAPVLSISDTAVVFQVPWNAVSSDLVPVRALSNASPSPFEAVLSIQVSSLYPSFLPFGPFSFAIPLALHQDFGSLVTEDQPALPGEIVHLYGTGFGPVNGATQTGVAAPVSGPLQSTTAHFTCSFNDAAVQFDAPVLFSGLAPGTIGLYQLDMQVPAGVRNGGGVFYCSSSSSGRLVSGVLPIRGS